MQHSIAASGRDIGPTVRNASEVGTDDCEPVDAMTARGLIVAIDGPSAAGKSSTGTLVARRLGYLYVESGAFYRALAWKVRERGLDPTDDAALRAFCETTVVEVMRTPAGARILVDRRDVTDELRMPEMSRIAAQTAPTPIAREPMLRLQRTMAKDGGGGGAPTGRRGECGRWAASGRGSRQIRPSGSRCCGSSARWPRTAGW